MKQCANCGRDVEAYWRFCEGCGAELPAPELPLVAGEAPAPPIAPVAVLPLAESRVEPPAEAESYGSTPTTGASRRWLWPTLLGVALLTGLAAGILLYTSLERTRDDLAATTADLDRTSSTLVDTEGELADTEEALTSMTSERDWLEGRVKSLKTDLRGVRGTLDAARSDLELQAGQISTLKTCLNGVSIAFDRVLSFDYRGAAAALQSVEGACNEAFALI